MSFSLVYLAHRFVYRAYLFVEHWYLGGFRFFLRKTIGVLEHLDKSFALKVTFRYWLKPLYQDYSIIGYILGFVFRTGRLFSGGLLYALIAAVGVAIYLLWAAFPIYIIAKGFLNI